MPQAGGTCAVAPIIGRRIAAASLAFLAIGFLVFAVAGSADDLPKWQRGRAEILPAGGGGLFRFPHVEFAEIALKRGISQKALGKAESSSSYRLTPRPQVLRIVFRDSPVRCAISRMES